MLKIVLLVVLLGIHKNCYGNWTQNDRQTLYLYRHQNSSQSETKSYLNSQSKVTSGLNINTKLGKDLDFIEAARSLHNDRNILRRNNRNVFKQLWTRYRTVNDHEELQSPNTGEILHRDSAENGGKKNENQSGQEKSVRFFRRNNHWKPKRVISSNPNNIQYEKTNLYKSEYGQRDRQPPNNFNYRNQNVFKEQVYSDCCNVVSNTISIHNTGSKQIHIFKAPDYLPPIDIPTYIASEYLPPKTGINDETNMTSTTQRPIERGDVPDDDEDSPEAAPAMAIPVPPLPDDEPTPTTDSTSIGISTSRVTTVKILATTPTNKLTTTAAEPSTTPESNRNLIDETFPTTSDTYFKGFEYLPPKDSSTLPTMTPQFPGPAPAMAMPVPPEPDDETEPPASTTSTPDYQTEETLSPPTSVTFRGQEYLPPEDRTTTPAMTPQLPGPAPAILPLPSELEESISTSLPVNDFGSVDILNRSNSSIPTVLDTNPFKAPEYLPPKQMVPVFPAAPAIVIPVPPDSDSNPNDSPNIDPRSFN